MRKIFGPILLWMLCVHSLFAAAPKISKDALTFTYKNSSARDVKLITSMNQYQTIFVMRKNTDGIWEIQMDLTQPEFQLKPGRYYYKLIVDHIYTPDPENQGTVTDPFTGEVSYFDVASQLIAVDKTPQKIGPLTYRFYYKNSSAWNQIQEIQFIGSFNYWHPYEHFLTQLDSQTWYIDFTFTRPGTYHYQYIVNGKWTHDPYNPTMGKTQTGETYSVVEVEN